jgi:GntR family transcriptional regulator, rspAB operon transcriptional repressor
MNEKTSLTDQVYRQIKEMILYGTFKSGELLTVGDLAVNFNISRTPIREAFTALKHDGLLDVLPHKGYMVSRIDLKDLENLFSVRILLEGGSAEFAAKFASEDAIEQLERLCVVDFNEKDENDLIFIMKTNLHFHISVAKASKNDRLANLIANNLDHLQRVLYWDSKNSSFSTMQEEHKQLVELIRNRKPAEAKNLMLEHIESSRSRIFSKSY